jgi:hypothetical protein
MDVLLSECAIACVCVTKYLVACLGKQTQSTALRATKGKGFGEQDIKHSEEDTTARLLFVSKLLQYPDYSEHHITQSATQAGCSRKPSQIKSVGWRHALWNPRSPHIQQQIVLFYYFYFEP